MDYFSSVQLLSRIQLFCHPMNRSTPGLPVHHGLFRSMLFSFQVFIDFLVRFLLMISSLIPLWSENIPCMISAFKILLKLFYCQRYASAFDDCFMGTWGKNVYNAILGGSFLKVAIKT